MLDKINEAAKSFDSDVENVKDDSGLEEIRLKYLSRKGLFAQLFEEFKSLPPEEKPKYGQVLNKAKTAAQSKFDELKTGFENNSNKSGSYVDLTLPGRKQTIGKKHIITQTMDQIRKIFKGMGFSVHTGPELESDYYNFGALNFPPDHPARDMQDTFFVNPDFLLRTHTSPAQIRIMEKQKPPIRAIVPGKVYRNEAISFKSYCLFHQVEGLCVGEDITFAELKATLVSYVKQFYGKDVKYRFRASFFPFTEPSAEMDIWWQAEGKEGRWLEILGCGMVDPNVLRNVNIDAEKYVGYAFGIGVERQAMIKYGIEDIRLLFDNDNRFLMQF